MGIAFVPHMGNAVTKIGVTLGDTSFGENQNKVRELVIRISMFLENGDRHCNYLSLDLLFIFKTKQGREGIYYINLRNSHGLEQRSNRTVLKSG